MKKINNYWEFTSAWTDGFLHGEDQATPVRLPHTVQEVPLHLVRPESFQGLYGYRRHLDVPAEWQDRRLFIQLDGAAHVATLYCNGRALMTHRCGYTAMRAEITGAVQFGGDNLIAVRLDTSENSDIPPFGGQIDYLTYGGLYRDAWLDVRPQTFLDDVYIATPSLDRAVIQVRLNGPVQGERIRCRILDRAQVMASAEFEAGQITETLYCPAVRSWSPEHPVLYQAVVELIQGNTIIDVVKQPVGFRTIAFSEDEFILNGMPYFLRGLNRHQCYPYIGDAAPEALQREDARILKKELAVNAVRTSHYPQSHYFLDECDRLGLLVLTEIPGWQHIGGKAWQDQAVANTREMVLQYRRHPSIFLWGVRINESQDCDDLYKRTNQVAHRLDPYRPTTGVRYLEHSSLLEDVYSFNDFSYAGTGIGAKAKKSVTEHTDKALLITEANGHMFPTKAFDPWSRRQEQALRHAAVLNRAAADGEHAGCFQWCMFDYPTHRDFGSGDRVCYHGVMDRFRNPKLAAAFYASQGDQIPVLEIGSSMTIGDYDGGRLSSLYAFTNADEVEVYYNDRYVAAFHARGWPGLRHGPVQIDDLVGALLDDEKDLTPRQASLIRDCLNEAIWNGLTGFSPAAKAKMASLMIRYHMTYSDAAALYGRYAGGWGSDAGRWRFVAKKNGVAVATVSRSLSPDLHLEVKADHTELKEGETYDMCAVRIRILDIGNGIASYAQLPIHLSTKGPVELVGPDTVTAEGGMTGTYLRTNGHIGRATLTITCEGLAPVRLELNVTGGKLL